MGYNGYIDIYFRDKILDVKEVYNYLENNQETKKEMTEENISFEDVQKIVNRINEDDDFCQTTFYNDGEEDETDNRIISIIWHICSRFLKQIKSVDTCARDSEIGVIITSQKLIDKKEI